MSSRDQILRSASSLFAQKGYEATSVREITQAAGVNNASVHYHFGGKLGVLREIFERQALRLTTRRRLLLDKLPHDERGRARFRDVMEAFIRPGLEGSDADTQEFTRLRARIFVENTGEARQLMGEIFNETSRRTYKELLNSREWRSEEEAMWCFHFLMCCMTMTMSASNRTAEITSGRLDPFSSEEAVERILDLFCRAYDERGTTSNQS